MTMSRFPSPADDYMESELNLHEHLVKHPAATFFMPVIDTSMLEKGYKPGDLLVIDRSLRVYHGRMILAKLNGELLVRRLVYSGQRPFLTTDCKGCRPLEINDESEFEAIGVVTYCIHNILEDTVPTQEVLF